MEPKQYLPYRIFLKNIPIIIYPAKDDADISKAFSRSEISSIEEYLFRVLPVFEDKITGADVLVCYVWNDGKIPMVDVWKITRNTISDDSGFLYDCFILRDDVIELFMGIASGNSLIVLTSEELLLRKLIIEEWKTFFEASDREKYIPEFPLDSNPTEKFFQ